jgi:hypothetical protein
MMRSKHSPWTDDVDKALRRMREAKLSYSAIAAKLNATFGTAFTRSAIAGHIDRAKLSGSRIEWSQEEIAALVEKHKSGAIYAEIAAVLTRRFGRQFTRAMICTKIHRLGLPARSRRATMPAVKRRKRQPAQTDEAEIAAPVAPAAPKTRRVTRVFGGPDLVPTKPVTLEARRRHQCGWPVNDGDPFLFCGAPKAPDDPTYCPHHRWRSIDKPAARERYMQSLRQMGARP